MFFSIDSLIVTNLSDYIFYMISFSTDDISADNQVFIGIPLWLIALHHSIQKS